ncbi:MAG TPA: DUF5335 family protein [Thermoanaerobaculia bacterium]|nr:DUF5335 family protein [Thermoanaerobaculia bacterium]
MKHNLPHSDWGEFTDAFTRSHDGWIISLYVQKPFEKREYLVHDVPFHGITTEVAGGHEVVLITTNGRSHLAHIVPDPRRMFVHESPEGVDAAISIVDGSGAETTAELRSPMPVTAVDGIAHDRR